MQLEKKRTLLLLAPSHRQRRPSRGVGVFIRPLLPSPASRSRKDYKQRDTPPPPPPPKTCFTEHRNLLQSEGHFDPPSGSTFSVPPSAKS